MAMEEISDRVLQLARILEAEEQERKRPTRERHAREKMAQVAKDTGVSRELLRKTARVMEVAEQEGWADEFQADVMAGKTKSVHRLYDFLKGDTRLPLYVKLSSKVYQ